MDGAVTWRDLLMWFVVAPLVINVVGFVAVGVWFKVKDWRQARNRRKWGIPSEPGWYMPEGGDK